MRGSGETERGEPSALEALAVPLIPSLYNFSRWLTRDEAEAGDLVQETFARALDGLATFEEGTSFEAWIFRILKSAFLSSRSGPAQGPPHAAAPLETGDDAGEVPLATTGKPEPVLVAAVDLQLVRAAITDLPEAWREVVLLRDVEGLSCQDVAHVLSIPVGTVRSRLSRGRGALRASIRAKG